MSNAAAMQTMQMQLGGSAAPRLRSSYVPASWTAVPSCPSTFGHLGLGHVVSFGRTEQTRNDVIAANGTTGTTGTTKANPAFHRQPEEIST